MKLVFIIGVLLLQGIVYAAPSITNLSGTVTHGESVILSGVGFGTKTMPGPHKFDSFEAGTSGNLVTGWESGAGSGIARYSNSVGFANSIK